MPAKLGSNGRLAPVCWPGLADGPSLYDYQSLTHSYIHSETSGINQPNTGPLMVVCDIEVENGF
jgi:hypothetical protein